MELRVTACYFSPTHGTRAYVRAVAEAMPGERREAFLLQQIFWEDMGNETPQ